MTTEDQAAIVRYAQEAQTIIGFLRARITACDPGNPHLSVLYQMIADLAVIAERTEETV